MVRKLLIVQKIHDIDYMTQIIDILDVVDEIRENQFHNLDSVAITFTISDGCGDEAEDVADHSFTKHLRLGKMKTAGIVVEQ